MLASILLTATALMSARALAAPVDPDPNAAAAMPGSMDTLSEYFNVLATRVQQSKPMAEAPVCNLTKAVVPLFGAAYLPPPSRGLTLKHVAVGRGVQKYTCDTQAPDAAPVAAGAAAILFNATCLAATHPDLAALLPKVVLQFNLTSDPGATPSTSPPSLAPTDLVCSGRHYFLNSFTPYFDLNVPGLQLGTIPAEKNSSVPAPADAPRGQRNEPAVAWLKLIARPGATGGLQEVYRVDTAGGSPPATCRGLPPAFEVQYAAQYWFFGK